MTWFIQYFQRNCPLEYDQLNVREEIAKYDQNQLISCLMQHFHAAVVQNERDLGPEKGRAMLKDVVNVCMFDSRKY
jgi:hypothetical protein